MKGSIYIEGVIGDFDDSPKKVILKDVMRQVSLLESAHGEDLKEIEVSINSAGGLVDVGNQIYDYLNDLKTRYMVNTRMSGDVGSIASKIYLVGQKRAHLRGARIFIHNPFTQTIGDAETLAAHATELKKLEGELAKFYEEKTGQTVEGITALMSNETGIDENEALDMNFSTEVVERVTALAMVNFDDGKKEPKKEPINSDDETFLNTIMEKSNIKKLAAFFNTILNNEPAPEILNIDYTTAEGVILRIAAEDEAAAMGMPVMVVGEEGEELAAEGTYPLEDGRSLVVNAEGNLDSIVSDAPDEMAELKAEIEALKNKLETAEAENKALTETVEALNSEEFKQKVAELEKAADEIEAERAEMADIKTHFNLPLNKTFNKAEPTPKGDSVKERKEARREEYKEKKRFQVQS